MARLLAVGDIHGCFTALETLLGVINLQPDDKIITLGDYVDRGDNTNAVLGCLIQLHQQNQLIALKGNHDLVMLAARNRERDLEQWLDYGGKATLESYRSLGESSSQPQLTDIPESHWNFLENICLDYYETKTHFFVHANADPNLALSEQSEKMLFWEKFHHPVPHCSGKTMICGHTSQKSGKPVNLGYAICIDTWVYGQGWLTALEVETGKLWQANQKRQTQTAWISEFKPR